MVVGLCGLVALACVSCTAPSLRDQATAVQAAHRSALQGDGPPRRVLLVSVAGLEAEAFLDAWGHVPGEGDRVRMPELARLAREGAVATRVEPPTPGAIYPSHATLATGRLPRKHGVIADRTLDADGKRSLPFWDNRLLQGSALWDAAIGRGVISLGWPTTQGARIELLVPDGQPPDPAMPWLDFMRDRSSPMLVRELEDIAETALGEREGDDEAGRDPRSWPTAVEKDAAMVELACRVAASDRDPGLWLIRLDQSARFARAAGVKTPETDAALGRIDAALGRLLVCLETAGRLADSAIFVTGDVVFQPVHTRVDPNVVLVGAGLVGRDPRSSTGVRSWLALSRSNGRSAYVYARDAENALIAREVLEKEAADSRAFDVVPAAELAAAGADPQAWFGLSARPGYVIGNGLAQPGIRPAEVRASEGTLPFLDPAASGVGLVVWGRGIRSRVRLPDLELVDVAPTIASLLGLRLDEDLDGNPVIGLLRAAVPPPPPGPKRLGVGQDADVDRVLRELGGGRDLGTDR
jgi:hypothetical protein